MSALIVLTTMVTNAVRRQPIPFPGIPCSLK
jgi:hypothetical protein